MEQKKKLETVWKECGDFEAIKSVSKCLKRIGQLFSAATSGVARSLVLAGHLANTTVR